MNDAPALSAFVREIRNAADRMAAASDALHAAGGTSLPARVILETIEVTGPQTVPAIARRRNTSRQNIQVQVDDLRAAGFIEIRPNPEHRRSGLVALSEAGRARCRDMRARESALLARVAEDLAGQDLRTAAAAVRAFAAALVRIGLAE